MTNRSFWVLRGVGGTLLAFLGACAGRYDVGDGNGSGGNAGEASGGSSSDDSGGKGSSTGGKGSGVGGSGTDTGGSDASGGTSAGSAGTGTAGTTADTGGTNAGGSDASGGTSAGTGPADSGGTSPGGTSAGGSAGASADARCGVEPIELSYGTLATPEIVWKRLSRLLRDEETTANPEIQEASPEWAAGMVSDWLEDAREGGEPLPGLVRFTSAWLRAEASGDTAEIVEGTAEALGASDASFFSVAVPSDGPGLFEDASLNRLRPGLAARGATLQQSLYCVEIGFPPPNSTDVPPAPPGVTRREWLTEATSGATCMGCHHVLNSAGASLEGFDPTTGEPRTTDEQGLPIDSSGTFETFETSETYAFTSIVDLMPALAPSCEVARCFVQQVASDATTAIGSEPLSNAELEYVLYAYADADYSIEALLRALAETPTFLE